MNIQNGLWRGFVIAMVALLCLGVVGLITIKQTTINGFMIETMGGFLLMLVVAGGMIYRQVKVTARQIRDLNESVDRQRLRFESLVQTTEGIVWEADATSFTFSFVSQQAEAIFGYPIADWYQPGFWATHLHPEDRSWAPDYCLACVRRLEAHDFQYRFIAQDGRVVWLQDFVAVVSEDGKPRWLRGLMLDITKRKASEAKTAGMLAEQKALLDNALVGIVHLRHRTVVSCNPRFEQLLGYQPGELTGQSSRVFYADDAEFERIGGKAYAVIGQGTSYSGEVVLKRKDQTVFWGALTGQALDPLFPQEGSIWIYADISDRKRAADEANTLRRAVEQSPVSIEITDAQGLIEYVNPRFTLVTGYSRDEVLGKNPSMLQSGETPPDTYRELWACILTGREWRGLLHNRRKNGELFWEDASIAPVLNEEGKTTHYIAVKEDVTERRMAEAELASYRESLETQVVLRTQDLALAMQKATAADRAKGEFLTHMSHEIRTPMNAIIGFCCLLERTPVNAQQREYLTNIDRASQHLLELVNNVLDLSKIAAGKIELEKTEFSLSSMVARLSSLINQKAAEKSLVLNVVLDDTVPDTIIGDSLRLNQVLINLLTNAIKFTEAGRVCLNISEGEVMPGEHTQVLLNFSVTDTGIGISTAELEQIFEPFAQADASITRKYGGTGLGLPIARELIALLGGRLQVKSEKGVGTRFFFSLPFGRGESMSAAEAATNTTFVGHTYRFHDVKVLLAEDQLLNQQVAVELLSNVGVEVSLANNGQEALDLLLKAGGGAFDLVLMDIQMPVMDGLSAMRKIRESKSLIGLPVIAMTAHVLAEERRQSLAAGANDHLGKPFQPDDLYSVIANWVAPEKVTREQDSATDRKAAPDRSVAIDVEAGLSRFAGRRDKYRLWLIRFVDEKRSELEALHALFRDGNKESLARQVHSLKGLSGTLGLVGVFEACRLLEAAVRSEEAESAVPDLLGGLAVAMQIAFAAIAAYSDATALPDSADKMPNQPEKEGAPAQWNAISERADLDGLKTALLRLQSLLENGAGESVDWADECLRRARLIRNVDCVAGVGKLLELVQGFEFDRALAQVQRLVVLIGRESAGVGK